MLNVENTEPIKSPEPQSDIRLKRDISPVGQLPNGLQLYRFKYHWSEKEFVGVMAQEVLEVMPDAVELADNGYYDVDYDKLGAKFMTYDAWLEQRSALQ